MAVAAVTAKDERLMALPAELLIGIIAFLPSCEAVILRGVNKQMKHFVDCNALAINKGNILYNRKRVARRLDSLTNTKHLLPTDALARWIAYYGIPNESGVICGGDLLSDIANAYHDDCNPVRMPGRDLYEFQREFVTLWASTYKDTPRSSGGDNILKEIVRQLLVNSNAQCSPEHLKKMCQQILDPRLMDGPHYSTRFGAPKFFITKNTFLKPGEARQGLCPTISDNLYIPALPTPSGLTYCVKTRKVANLAGYAASGLNLSLFQQAALLEEVFIW